MHLFYTQVKNSISKIDSIQYLKSKMKQRKDIGNEYFEGCKEELIIFIQEVIK